MPLNQIKPGMRGNGLTIFEGNKIESFGVEIIDNVYNYFPSRNLILVKLTGERANYTGVAAGMSGSPIYINGQLIGALAYRIGNFMKDPIAGVTPIEEMLRIFDKEKDRHLETRHFSSKNKGSINDYLNSGPKQKFDLLNLLKSNLNKYFGDIQPIKTPLIMSGLEPLVFEKISQQLDQTQFALFPGGRINHAQISEKEQLKVGEAVGAVIINGDFDISAVGTVTFRDGDKILAFGHPLFNSGPVNIPLAKADIITTLASLYASNKFAASTEIIGNIRQDRSSGILAMVGKIPPMIPVDVKIKSPLFTEKKYHFNVVKDHSTNDVLPVFLWITLINTIESARLGTSDYGLQLTGRIKLNDSDDILLDNFYSGSTSGYFSGAGLDITEAAFDVVMTLRTLMINNFNRPDVSQIELNFEAVPGQNAASIEKVYFSKKQIKPGETVDIFIYLKPYQAKSIEIKKQIRIPENISSTKATMVIGCNSEIEKREKLAGIGKFTPDSYEELIKILNQRRRNNLIFLQLKVDDRGAILNGNELTEIPPSIFSVLNQEKSQSSFKPINEKVVKEWQIPTNFHIQGGRLISLEVESN